MKKNLNEELKQVNGGMSEEEFQNLEIGTRVHVDSGLFREKCGIVQGFVDDILYPGVHLCAVVLLDDGTIENFSACEITKI